MESVTSSTSSLSLDWSSKLVTDRYEDPMALHEPGSYAGCVHLPRESLPFITLDPWLKEGWDYLGPHQNIHKLVT